jgi:hypothetical protein
MATAPIPSIIHGNHLPEIEAVNFLHTPVPAIWYCQCCTAEMVLIWNEGYVVGAKCPRCLSYHDIQCGPAGSPEYARAFLAQDSSPVYYHDLLGEQAPPEWKCQRCGHELLILWHHYVRDHEAQPIGAICPCCVSLAGLERYYEYEGDHFEGDLY